MKTKIVGLNTGKRKFMVRDIPIAGWFTAIASTFKANGHSGVVDLLKSHV